MDFSIYDDLIGFGRRLPSRISALRSNFNPSKRLPRPFLIAGALLLAAVSGLTAERFASDAAREDFEKSHAPSSHAWDHGLGAQGFRPVLNPEEIHSASRKLPLRTSANGSVWTTADLKWVVVLGEDSGSGNPFRIYCWGECRPFPQAWVPEEGGSGWHSFDSLISHLEKSPLHESLGVKKVMQKVTKKGRRNPGEILY
jgi:hypothetical protein